MSEKIQKEMQDKQRYEILRDKTLDIYPSEDTKILKRLGTVENLEAIANMQFVEAKRFFKKLDSEFTHVGSTFENSDMELEFEFTKHGLRESIQKQKSNYDNYAKLLSCLPEVIDSAVGLEIHDDYKVVEKIKNVYVLASAFHDGHNIHPVKLLIKEYIKETKENNKLYVAVSLENFKIKKEEADIINTTALKGYAASSQTSSKNIISQYPIKHLLGNIDLKDIRMLKYIPNEFLSYEQREVKAEHISKEREKYGSKYFVSDAVNADIESLICDKGIQIIDFPYEFYQKTRLEQGEIKKEFRKITEFFHNKEKQDEWEK